MKLKIYFLKSIFILLVVPLWCSGMSQARNIQKIKPYSAEKSRIQFASPPSFPSFSAVPYQTNFINTSKVNPIFTQNPTLWQSMSALNAIKSNPQQARYYSSFLNNITHKIYDLFDTSPQRKIYRAFENNIFSEQAVQNIIKNKGKISYPSEYINSEVPVQKSDSPQWVSTTYSPLSLAIELFGDHPNEAIFQHLFDQYNPKIFKKFRDLDPQIKTEIQYNLTKSLIDQNTDINEVIDMGKKYGFEGFSENVEVKDEYPLKNAAFAYNLGAVKALLEKGAAPDRPDRYVHVMDPSTKTRKWSYVDFLPNTFNNYSENKNVTNQDHDTSAKIFKLLLNAAGRRNTFAEEQKRYFDRMAREANASRRGPEPFINQSKKALLNFLNLPQTATDAEITKARSFAIITRHPDKLPNGSVQQAQATEFISTLNDLYKAYKENK